jgi:enterochelin esterase-like enzyme
MVRRITAFGLAMTLAASVAAAQAPATPAAPGQGAGRGGGRGNVPQLVSPEVHADGRITLRYRAPNATQVTASGELDGKPHPLTKDAEGVWSVTIGPLPPDIYTYAFNVDGVVALDPRNANTKFGYGNFGAVSIVQVPGNGPQFYDVKDVPHGEVRIKPYVSKTLGVGRTAWIYTPPGYDQGKDYPVMYLLHGAGDIESGWTMIGRANNILDNAIAEGRAVPMVVVMPLGYTTQSFWAGPARTSTTAAPQGGAGALSLVGQDLLNDVLPMVERDYKVSRSAEKRAIAGLSMGGGQTMNIAFNRPELFRYVVAMSPAAGGVTATNYPEIFANPAKINSQFKLFWMPVGQDDTLTGPGDRKLSEAFKAAGINHEFTLTPGRHEWTVWRHHLNDLMPKLFK